MKCHIILSIAVSCLAHLYTCAQNKDVQNSLIAVYRAQDTRIDSLAEIAFKEEKDTLKVQALSHLYNSFLYKAPEVAKSLALKELKISEDLNYLKGQSWATYHLGAYYQNSAEIDSARHYLKRALGIHKQMGTLVSYASVLSSIAYLEHVEGNYDEALSTYEEAMKIYKDSSMYRYAITQGDIALIYMDKGFYKLALEETLAALRVLDTIPDKPWRQADAQRQVGQIEFLRKNYPNALSYFKRALEIYKDQNDKVFEANVSYDIGEVYLRENQYDSATVYLNSSLALARTNDIKDTEGKSLLGLGKVFRARSDYSKAIETLQKALELQRSNNFYYNILETQNELGYTYYAMNDLNRALAIVNETILSEQAEKPISVLKDAHQYRGMVYQKMGLWERALNDFNTYQVLTDSIYNIAKSQQMEELRVLYETEKKEQQIALQENEITLLEQKASINTLQKILLAGGLILALLGIYALRQKMKRNKAEKARVDAELAYKKKELTTHALHLAKKNEMLEGLKVQAQELQTKENSKGYQQLIHTINFDQQDDRNWENFTQYFEQVHKDFSKNVNLRYPDVTKNELRFMALIKMNMSSKEIATILNISADGVKKARQRLRKKMDLSPEDSLESTVMAI